MVRVIEIGKLDKAPWSVTHLWNGYTIASHLIKHPELISSDAKFEAVEYVMPVGVRSLRIDLIFEGMDTVYLVECESDRGCCLNDGKINSDMEKRLMTYKKVFAEMYVGGKGIEIILAIPLTGRGKNLCPCCGNILDENRIIIRTHDKETSVDKGSLEEVLNFISSSGGEIGLQKQIIYKRYQIPVSDLNIILNTLKEQGEIIEYTGKSTGGRVPTIYKATVIEE